MPRRPSGGKPAVPNAPGDFLENGRFVPQGTGHREATQYVWGLVKARRASEASPNEWAARLRNGPFPAMWPCPLIGMWDLLTATTDWSIAPTSTDAEEALKREGRGDGVTATMDHGHWEGAHWWPGRGALPKTDADGAARIAELAQTIGVDLPPEPIAPPEGE